MRSDSWPQAHGYTPETILVTQYGRPFSAKALGVRMQNWTRLAGPRPGHTLQGLHKTLGKLLAERGATTRQIMAILGHDNIAHAELYRREAEQRLLAADGISKLTAPQLTTIKGGKRDGWPVGEPGWLTACN